MKFVVLGAGALGSIIAAHLARAGEDVLLLARGERARVVAADGLAVDGLVTFTTPCPVETEPARVRSADVLIVTVKTYDTMAALEPLSGARVAHAFSIQNGVLKNRQLAEVFGQDAVLGATGLLSGEVRSDGVVNFTLNQAIELGALAGADAQAVREIVARLDGAGLNARSVPDIAGAEWSKFVTWSGSMAGAVLTRSPTHRLLSDPASARVVAGIIRETAAVARALGVTLGDVPPIRLSEVLTEDDEAAVAALGAVGARFRVDAPDHRISTLQDIERGRRLEIEETLGHTVAEAVRLGVPAPTVTTCYRLISALSRGVTGAR